MEHSAIVRKAIQERLATQDDESDKRDIEVLRNYDDADEDEYIECMLRQLSKNDDSEKLLNNHQIHAIMKNKNTHTISLPLVSQIVGFQKGYTLDNMPDYCEAASLQKYRFVYTPEQLREMFATPKIIIDTHYNFVADSSGKRPRTSFFAIAPHAKAHMGIPLLYRFSVLVDTNNPNHYSISMHAIIGGKEDGWLFLGRLDNDDTSPHSRVASTITTKKAKRTNAVPTKIVSQAQKNVVSNAQKQDSTISPEIYCIPFPHIHQPDRNYDACEGPEDLDPKFLRQCTHNNFEGNLQYMMKIFNISDQPHLKPQNKMMSDILKEEFKITTINPEPNPKKLMLIINSSLRENRPKFVKDPTQKAVKPAKDRTIRTDIYRSPKYKNKERQMLMKSYKYS